MLRENARLEQENRALGKTEERFTLAIASSGDGVYDWDTVTDQVFMSERAQKLHGLEPAPRFVLALTG